MLVSMGNSTDLTAAVKSLALETGFARVGIAPAGADCRGDVFRAWLDAGYHADMAYMSRNAKTRLCPFRLVEGARAVVCLAVSYAPDAAANGLIARYARGCDYHKVLKKRCHALMDRIRELTAGFEGRAFVDSGPIAERSLAAAAGLGWIGRSGCLIVPGLGSYVVLCEILCNVSLVANSPVPNDCRDCGACVKACPTGAIVSPGVVDARRCLSYQTIENRRAIPQALWPLAGCRLFGCDACQEVCPHNDGLARGDAELTEVRPPAEARLEEILRWETVDWDAATRGSAARRAGCEMLLRNAAIAAGNSDDPSLAEPLSALAGRHPQLREAVDWAIARLEKGV